MPARGVRDQCPDVWQDPDQNLGAPRACLPACTGGSVVCVHACVCVHVYRWYVCVYACPFFSFLWHFSFLLPSSLYRLEPCSHFSSPRLYFLKFSGYSFLPRNATRGWVERGSEACGGFQAAVQTDSLLARKPQASLLMDSHLL